MTYSELRGSLKRTQARMADLLGVGERHWQKLEATGLPVKQRHLDVILAQLDREKNIDILPGLKAEVSRAFR